MAATKLLRQYATRTATRRLTRAIPWIGGAIALVTLGSAIRRKGFVGGTVHTGLDFIPFVGTAKNLAEAVRGRDFIPDRDRSGQTALNRASVTQSARRPCARA
ncbi:MAG TPA: hypothetical protein VGQ16_15005 [Vicinamibacterales bacterium]|jgi:hypothetical protein|nr:hypothetical protein [Vicinamibacterales bacterium]